MLHLHDKNKINTNEITYIKVKIDNQGKELTFQTKDMLFLHDENALMPMLSHLLQYSWIQSMIN